MKTFVSILLVIVGVPALAQGPSVDSISIGDVTRQVRLALGTPKEAVLSSLREFSVEETSGDFMVSPKNAPGSFPYAIIRFKNGRLSSVSKSWCCWNDDSGVAVVRGIYELFRLLAAQPELALSRASIHLVLKWTRGGWISSAEEGRSRSSQIGGHTAPSPARVR